MQTTLFNDDVLPKKESGLKIISRGAKPLTKNQKLFNSLTSRIEKLEKEIITEQEKLSKLLEVHNKSITPLENKVAHSKLKLAMTLAKTTEINKFTKKQTNAIVAAIVDLCDDAFNEIEPTPEEEAFYDKWSKVPFKVDIGIQKEFIKEDFADFMSQMFGMDVDTDELDGSAESFARRKEKLRNQFEQAQEQKKEQNHKKSKKQEAREIAQKEKEEIKNKSLRSIYIALVKILHPDTETDPSVKAEKDELMKKVTVAYDKKDLSTLLKLEMEWVHNTSEHLEKLTEDKLKIYIAALRQQATELQNEIFSLYYHPRFAKISDFGRMPEKMAIKEMQNFKSELKSIFENLNIYIANFQIAGTKKHILEFIDEYQQGLFGTESDDFWNVPYL